ncbi:putative scytalidoglutamic peptidase protein [Botrytis fragariae]|uniref:Putative scytalidoglutamic peptidase protein n=1 Tax=Botrytis fragariae TaxID=1964551 RepID=A0A8H6EGT1_9HELO|nr:putative scytalidoglutamic peptidase protein [Botrytis fragariae]KAF5871638.1 putative scytalidoglutamic peptidase protein [Botrytis fragariae]
MKFTTTIALSGLIASSLAAPSRPNQARGHRGNTLQKSQKAGGFAQPSAGYPGGFGGQQGGRARPTGSYGAAGSRQSSSAVAASIVATPIASSAATSIASSAVINIASSSTTSASAPAATAHADDEYNISWAGAVLDDGGSTIYTGVYTEFVVPIPTKPTRGETSAEIWTVSSWVGIDGYEQSSECAGLWQAGVDASIDSSGKLSYDAWYEWYPADTLGFSFSVTAGDTIAVNLTYSSFTEGTVTMENKSTGKSETKTVTSTDQLCGQAAEWIMEDLSIDGSTIGLANYGNVTFSNAYAATKEGKQVGPTGANIMDIETTSNEILTSSSVTEDSVVVAYV